MTTAWHSPAPRFDRNQAARLGSALYGVLFPKCLDGFDRASGHSGERAEADIAEQKKHGPAEG